MEALREERLALHGEHPPSIRRPASRVAPVLALAAAATIAFACQAALVGAFLLAWPGTAR